MRVVIPETVIEVRDDRLFVNGAHIETFRVYEVVDDNFVILKIPVAPFVITISSKNTLITQLAGSIQNNNFGSSKYLYLYIPPNSNGAGLSQLGTFLSGMSDLIVVDPYIFKADWINSGSAYRGLLFASGTPRKMTIITTKNKNKRLDHIDPIQQAAAESLFKQIPGLTYTIQYSNDIHDRIWIKDRIDARAVGTSLNGLDKKISFILTLPKRDLQQFLGDLRSKGLI